MKRSLHADDEVDGITRDGEHGDEAVTLALFLGAYATMELDALGNDGVEEAGHRLRHGIRLRLPEPDRTLDIGQDEGQGAAGKRLGYAPSSHLPILAGSGPRRLMTLTRMRLCQATLSHGSTIAPS